MKNLFLVSVIICMVVLAGCSKMQEKKIVTDEPSPKQEMPNDDIHNKLKQQSESESDGDSKATELTKAADNSFDKYASDKSESSKKEAVEKGMNAAMYLMYDADLPPKEKYRPALRYFRKVLELDPANKEAKVNKDKIEEIYKSMGMPVPQS